MSPTRQLAAVSLTPGLTRVPLRLSFGGHHKTWTTELGEDVYIKTLKAIKRRLVVKGVWSFFGSAEAELGQITITPRQIEFGLGFDHDQTYPMGIPDKWHTDPGDGGHLEIDKLDVERVKRDNSGVTTLLLVNNDEARHIRGSRPEGLLTSTARTFVHDGTTTEFGTQVIGTSLDHGRFYAQLLQTSSRVFFGHQERIPASKLKTDERVSLKSRYFPVKLENYLNPSVLYDIRPAETILVYPTRADDSLNLVKPEVVPVVQASPQRSDGGGVEILVKENSGNIFYNERVKEKERQALNEAMRLQLESDKSLNINPMKAYINDLPTYTVRHDFAPSGFSWSIPEVEKEEVTVKLEKSKFRSGKGFPGKPVQKKLDTVTYMGFADFTTTVGDTVIVFMPNTRDSAAKQTAITEDTTLATSSRDDQQVMTTIKTFMSHSPGMVTRTIPGHNLSMQTSLPTQVAERQSKAFEVQPSVIFQEPDDSEESVSEEPSSVFIEPSETSQLPVSTSEVATEPLATFATTITKTFNSGGSDKPLGLVKSIGGTMAYDGTTTHFTSLFYGTYVGGTYTQILKTSSSVFYFPQEIAATKVSSQSETLAPEADLSTTEHSPDEEQLTTLNDEGKTTIQIPETTPEPEEDEEEDEDEDKVTPTEEYITRIVPTTVYKTFTYLTTFFIPAADGTTTSIRSREVVSSELSLVTKVIETDVKYSQNLDKMNEINPTEINLIDNSIDPEFLPPATRVLAPEEIITTTEEPETETYADEELGTTTAEAEETTKGEEKETENEKVKEDKKEEVKEKEREDEKENEKAKETVRGKKVEDGSGSEDDDHDDEDDDEENDDDDEEEKEKKEEKKIETETVKVKEKEPEKDDEDEDENEGDEEEEKATTVTTKAPTTIKVTTTTTESIAKADDTTKTEASSKHKVKPEIKKVLAPTSTGGGGEDDEEEIEVIFKTIFTTYTYLTTFFQESSTSISSREVVVTNVITSTLENSAAPTARGLSVVSTPTVKTVATSVVEESSVDSRAKASQIDLEENSEIESETESFDEDSEINSTPTLEVQTSATIDSISDLDESEREEPEIEPSTSAVEAEQTATETPQLQIHGVKTLYTTFTYFTTLFEKGATNIKSRTEVVTNVVNPTVSALPESILQNEELLKSKFEMLLREQQSLRAAQSSSIASTKVYDSSKSNIYTTPPTPVGSTGSGRSIITPSSSNRGKYGTLVRKSKVFNSTPVQSSANELEYSGGFPKLKGDKPDRTIVRKRIRTKSRLIPKSTTIDENLGITTIRLDPTPIADDEKIVLQTMITDVKKSTSGGNRQVKRIAPPEPVERPVLHIEDQISSESNNQEIEPSPTLLLQTSYTTFTYFTTVYKGTTSDVISRLETITNVVTETLKPDVLITPALSPEDATLPITYFTTFTYWTTLYRDGSTVITSREETISNIVTPTVEETITQVLETSQIEATPVIQLTESVTQSPSVETVFVPAFIPAAVSETFTEKQPETTSSITIKPIDEVTEGIISKAGIDEKPEPTTFYTTYTYFTTSYIGESTVLKSRLETVTNIVTAAPTISEITVNDLQTGRAVNSASVNQVIGETKDSPENSASELQTGLLSTIVSTSVNNGITTLYSTDIFGTFIDGLYAKILESTTKIATEVEILPSKSQEEQKTGVVSINEGRIVDADGISTTFFTTKAIGTSIEELYAQVVESTSSVVVDQDKKSALALLNGGEENTDVFRTGLVRLIEGSIVQDGTVTLYESRVIGTVIDGRYAQIIESTSSFKIEPSIAPSVVIKTEVTPTLQPSPSPAAVEASISDESKEEEQEEEQEEQEDEEDGYDEKDKGRVKSRLTFQSRKRTFTPVIRPFASRNRPTFLPKKKTIGASSAQTITRAFTPTVTATLATKADGSFGSSRNRFGGGRRSSTNQQEVRPTASVGGKRFSGRNRSSGSSAVVSPTYTPSRGRQSSGRISATPTLNLSSSRSRAFRVSSSRPGLNSERSNLSLRPRIRPTLAGPFGRSSAVPPPQDEANDLTTVVTEEETEVTVDDEVPTTTTTTTEDPNLARRNNNPLLRFRRPPLIPKATTTTTPKTTTTQAPRRGILGGRNNRPTTPTFTTAKPSRSRSGSSSSSFNRIQLQNRARPVNSLFPPRGLFKKPTPQEEKEESEEEEEEEEIENEDDEDNNFEESTAKEIEAEAEERSSDISRGRNFLPAVQIRPFRFQRTRTKRQAYEYGTRNRGGHAEPKYRRKGRPQVQDRTDYVDEETTEAPKVTSRNGRTYSGRTRATTPAPQIPSPPRIRPTLASAQKPQFTLREKDTTSSRTSNFRRSQSSSRRKSSNHKVQKPTESSLPRKPTRPRTSTTNQEYSRPTQRRNYNNNNSNSNRRPNTSSRGRGRFGDIEDTFTYVPTTFDGTITVTHKIPSEVSIPFVNGKSTEYRNVITAKPSLEIVGPHQYTISTVVNGGSVIYLNREVTETLGNGVTEVTRFLIHETPTTSVTFTPTTIRGRKTSFSHIVPSTVYDVENLVTTLQPQISGNAPLANILLSQLLLGNLNLPPNQAIGLNPPTGAVGPSTEYKTRTTTYVTSVTDHTSTVLPITFRGKEILTTIVDSSINVITATEYITDTIVVTPTLNPNSQINSLLLPALLQAQLLQPTSLQVQPIPQNPFSVPQNPFPVDLDHLNLEVFQHADETKIAKNNDIRGERDSEDINEEEKPEVRIKSRKKTEWKQPEPEPAKEVITLYVSGRRPGEFSTILSTVYSSDAPAIVRKRETVLDDIERLLVQASEVKQEMVLASDVPENESEGYLDYYVTPGVAASVESNEFNFETQSLESVLGDVSKHIMRSPSAREAVQPTAELKMTEQ